VTPTLRGGVTWVFDEHDDLRRSDAVRVAAGGASTPRLPEGWRLDADRAPTRSSLSRTR
jgi:hypothetical protein